MTRSIGERQIKYPIAIEWGDENTATSVFILDIPGAMTAGDSYDEAYAAAVEAFKTNWKRYSEGTSTS